MNHKRKKKKLSKQKRQQRLTALIESLLVFLIAGVPIVFCLLYAFGVEIPPCAFGITFSTIFVITGILFIIFSCLEKFGFSESGTVINWWGSWHQSKKESKANGIAVGIILVLVGLLFIYLTIPYI